MSKLDKIVERAWDAVAWCSETDDYESAMYMAARLAIEECARVAETCDLQGEEDCCGPHLADSIRTLLGKANPKEAK